MQVESWRIDRDSPTSPGTYGVVRFEEGQAYEHVGVLVPDTRLQAIADAPKCEHGNIYTHIVLTDIRTTKWCDGAPELAALLDALTDCDNVLVEEKE